MTVTPEQLREYEKLGLRRVRGLCPGGNKRSYGTQETAAREADHINQGPRHRGTRRKSKAYRCPTCGHWHIGTSRT